MLKFVNPRPKAQLRIGKRNWEFLRVPWTGLQSTLTPPMLWRMGMMSALQGRVAEAQTPAKEERDHGFFFLYLTLCRRHAGLKVTLLNNYLKPIRTKALIQSSKPEAERNGDGGLGVFRQHHQNPETRIRSSFPGQPGCGPLGKPSSASGCISRGREPARGWWEQPAESRHGQKSLEGQEVDRRHPAVDRITECS